jgi:hypothetical protein
MNGPQKVLIFCGFAAVFATAMQAPWRGDFHSELFRQSGFSTDNQWERGREFTAPMFRSMWGDQTATERAFGEAATSWEEKESSLDSGRLALWWLLIAIGTAGAVAVIHPRRRT